MEFDTARVIERPDDLSASWLAGIIGVDAIADFGVERIGTGQMSECFRVKLVYADGTIPCRPESLVLKVAATDPVSRQTGLALGLYEREVNFYRHIRPRLGGPTAPCYHAAIDAATGAFDLLLDDVDPAVVGDEIDGATAEQATIAVVELGRLHGPLLGDASLAAASWLNRESPLNQAMITPLYAGFVDRFGDQIASQHRQVCERLIGAFDGYLAQESAAMHGLVHGDYRLDNMLFGTGEAGRPLTVVDWQTVTWGPATTDLSYFIGGSVPTQDRRERYDTLLSAYHHALGPGAPLTLDEVREGVRRASFFGVMMAIVSPMLVERTDRGDQMFMTMLRRHCDHVLDTEALATLPTPAVAEPLTPTDDDELTHQPTAEPLWSESWYADFVDRAQGLGGWYRIGLVANQRRAWFHALLCGPDLPTIALVDCEVPLPQDPWAFRTDDVEFSHAVREALQSYHVDVRGRGRVYPDPSGLLRGEAGTPEKVAIDLVWQTDGTPYRYRVTTRYEIPCTVTGTITVGDATYRLESVPGQRDHSWGERDWWSMDWMWSALHLDDGTHLHGLQLQLPKAPAFGMGYIQGSDGEVTELDTVQTCKTFATNGLPLDTDLSLSPGEVSGQIRMCGHAPVALTSPDGRISQFPRAWVVVETADGRAGVGWMEWNRNLADAAE